MTTGPKSPSRLRYVASLCLAMASLFPAGAKKTENQETPPSQNLVKTTTTTIKEYHYEDGSVATTTTTDTIVSKGFSSETAPKKTPQKTPANIDPFGESGTFGNFTWGFDIGSGVDLTAHDMTMFSIGAAFGYKNRYFRFAGVGASILSMMNDSSHCYPIYAMVRTSFTPNYSPCFLEVKAGLSFSTFQNYGSQTDFFGSVGVGFTLAHSRKFTSHIALRGMIMPLRSVTVENTKHLDYILSYAAIGIGCAF